jgi:hypothetical protein
MKRVLKRLTKRGQVGPGVIAQASRGLRTRVQSEASPG